VPVDAGKEGTPAKREAKGKEGAKRGKEGHPNFTP
jgi:hypothetical protein